jgi:hypothetical protein
MRPTANGPIGLDKSNGEADDNDGVQLKINGVRYKEGIGYVHARQRAPLQTSPAGTATSCSDIVRGR